MADVDAGLDKIVLGMAHGQHRTRGAADDPLRHAAEQHV